MLYICPTRKDPMRVMFDMKDDIEYYYSFLFIKGVASAVEKPTESVKLVL